MSRCSRCRGERGHAPGVAARRPGANACRQSRVPLSRRLRLRRSSPRASKRRAVGAAVEVPLGARKLVGYVVAHAAASAHKLRPILRVLDEIPPLPEDLLKLAAFVSDYYLAPAGEVLRMLIPPPARRRVLEQMQITELGKALIKRDPEHHLKQVTRVRTPQAIAKKLELSLTDARTLINAWQTEGLKVTLGEKLVGGRANHRAHAHRHRKSEFTPTTEQAASLSQLFAAQDSGAYHGFLLHGVTGSGKTEVYLACIERALVRGKTALVLVPEIGLTPQVQARFEERFGGEVVSIHSALTPAQRRQVWYRVQVGDARVVVGPRSALFAPLAELGVIIVDEEHDESYKQDEAPRYHARDLSLVRAKHAQRAVHFGQRDAFAGNVAQCRARASCTLLTLRERATGATLPDGRNRDHGHAGKNSVKTGREIQLFSRTLDRAHSGNRRSRRASHSLFESPRLCAVRLVPELRRGLSNARIAACRSRII